MGSIRSPYQRLLHAIPAASEPAERLRGAATLWQCARRISELWLVRQGGAPAIRHQQEERLQSLLRHARARSRFYRDAYQELPQGRLSLQQLPVVTKRELMRRFDDWVTDSAVTRAGVEAFMVDRSRIGHRFLDKYLVWKSSGTSGEPGIFVQDEDAVATYDALVLSQLQTTALAASFAAGFWLHGGRCALIAATGEHFASISAWQRQARDNPWTSVRAISVLRPLDEWVAELNDYAPAFLASYPTALSLLAAEAVAGRLNIAPDIVWSGGEHLTTRAQKAIERAFRCPVVNEYGASECYTIASGCEDGWLHVNEDWVLLEPVDDHFRPTRAGELSHTVLLTNLANRVQPLLRYDLGDRIRVKAGPCTCGRPLPAILVDGRCDDVISLHRDDGRQVRLLPLALTTVVEEGAGIHHFQILQLAPDRIAIRCATGEPDQDGGTWPAASRALRDFLAQHGLSNVRVVHDERPPEIDPRSGKLRQVVALRR